MAARSDSRRIGSAISFGSEFIANTFPTTFGHDSVIQPICMVTELSIKAALVWDAVDPDSFEGQKHVSQDHSMG